MSRRTSRISGQLRAEVARVLREEVTDPRVTFVTLTRVDVAPDLSNALVYWSTFDLKGRTMEDVEDGLDSASPYVRRCLAKVLPLRRIPEIRFRHDPSLSLGSRTLSILRELDDGEKA